MIQSQYQPDFITSLYIVLAIATLDIPSHQEGEDMLKPA